MPFLSFLLQTQLSCSLLWEVFSDSGQEPSKDPTVLSPSYSWCLSFIGLNPLPCWFASFLGLWQCLFLLVLLCRLCNTKHDSPPSLGHWSWGHMEIISTAQGEGTQDSLFSRLGHISWFWAVQYALFSICAMRKLGELTSEALPGSTILRINRRH